MVLGLVVHLSPGEQSVRETLAAIDEQPAIEPGVLHGSRLPVVVEAADSADSHRLTDWLHDLNGVVHVDVTYVHFGDEAEECREGC